MNRAKMSAPPDDDDLPPPDDGRPSFDGDFGSPPGTPPDMDFPPDDDNNEFPPDDDEFPPDMDELPDEDLPNSSLPPLKEDEDFDDDMLPPDDFPEDSSLGPDDILGAPPGTPPSIDGDDDDLPPDDDNDPPPPDDDLDDLPPDDGSMNSKDEPPPDDDMSSPPPDNVSIVFSEPPDDKSLPPPDDSSVGQSGPPTKFAVAPRKSSGTIPLVRSRTDVGPNINELPSLSEGLSSKRQGSMLSRTARSGQVDGAGLGMKDILKLKRISEEAIKSNPNHDDGDGEEEEDDGDATLQSKAVESRPTLNRKQRSGQVPSKLKQNEKEWDNDNVSIITGIISSGGNSLLQAKDPRDETDSDFLSISGHFEGDPFEDLLVKVAENILYIKTVHDPNTLISFDLLRKAAVKQNPIDTTTFSLDHDGNIITFKASDPAIIKNFLLQFPPVALLSSSDSSRRSSEAKEVEPIRQINFASSTISEGHVETKAAETELPSKVNKFYEHGFEDLYNFKGDNKNQNMQTLDGKDGRDGTLSPTKKSPASQRIQRSTSRGATNLGVVSNELQDSVYLGPRIKGYNKQELIETKLATPKYCVRRVKQLCKWITSMQMWPKPVTIMTLHSELCSGVLLAKIMKVVVPDCQFLQLTEKALTKKAALQNIEQALGVIWRSKCVNNSRIPSSLEIFNGCTSKIAILLQEIFEVYVRRPLYNTAPKMFRWYNAILKQYSLDLPEEIFSEGDLSRVWRHMQSCCGIFCVIYHMYGPTVIGEGVNAVRIDSLRIVWNQMNISEFRSNVLYVFSLLRALDIAVLWDVEDWLSYPDTEFIVLQLFYIFQALQNKQCSLPPAQGTNAGVTSGPNGEPMVSGMVYSDTGPLNSKVFQRKRRTVLLGTGEDALPVLPIDTSGDSNSLFREVCPLGLLSNNVKIVHAAYEVKGLRAATERKNWNDSVLDVIFQNQPGTTQPDHLRKCNAPVTTTPNKPLQTTRPSSTSKDLSSSPRAKKSGVDTITAAMEELESEMTLSQREIDSLEDELVNRYTALEVKSTSMTQIEYSSKLNDLEKERMLLEEERFRLQEHFAMKLASIKSLHEEALIKNIPPAESPSKPPLSAQKSTTQSSVASIGPRKKVVPNNTALVRSERGWNRFSAKAKSHNFTFNKAMTEGVSAAANLKTGSLLKQNVFAKEPPPVEKTVDSMWQSFKEKMKRDTSAWASVRAKEQYVKIQELAGTRVSKLYATPPPTAITNRVPIRRDSQSSDHDSVLNNTADRVRKDELKLMLFEEKRRYIVMQEKLMSYSNQSASAIPSFGRGQMQSLKISQTSQPSASSPSPMLGRANSSMQLNTPSRPQLQHLVSSSNATPFVSTPGQRGLQSPSMNARHSTNLNNSNINAPLNKKALDALISWMNFSRVLTLRDRHSQRDYSCCVENEFIDGKDCYILKWVDPSPTESKSTPSGSSSSSSGFVYLEDITSTAVSSQDDTLLILTLSSNIRTLKSSGGRSTLNVKFSTDGECTKYKMGIDALKS